MKYAKRCSPALNIHEFNVNHRRLVTSWVNIGDTFRRELQIKLYQILIKFLIQLMRSNSFHCDK